jgi:hypothetical protein
MEKKGKRRRSARTTLAHHGQILVIAGCDAARRGDAGRGEE